MILNCPVCQRRLISHISPRCNWCGHEIQDAAYQEEAEIRRQAHALEQAQHDAQSRQWFQNTIDAYVPGGLGVSVPMGAARRPRTDITQEVRVRLEAEAAIAAAAQARRLQEANAAKLEAERQAQSDDEKHTQKQDPENRFNHLEL